MTERARLRRRVIVGVVGGLGLALLVRLTACSTSVVSSGSMLPTLAVGDRIVVDRLTYRLRAPAVGEVIVFRDARSGRELVKRVAGIAGDRIAMSDGFISRNGTPIPCAPLDEGELLANGRLAPAAPTRLETTLVCEESLGGVRHRVARGRLRSPIGAGSWEVPAGRLFVLGDARDDSEDSRTPPIGLVPDAALVGRAVAVLWSSTPELGWAQERTLTRVR